MKRMTLLIVVIGLVLVTTDISLAQCPEDGGPDYGNPTGTFMEVTAYSNGAFTGLDCDYNIARYQCVELTRRFVGKHFFDVDGDGVGDPSLGSVGAAANMWDILHNRYGFARYENGDTAVSPMATDVIVWWGGPAGHVGIVSDVLSNQVEVFEQNIQVDNAFRWLGMNRIQGIVYNVDHGAHMSNSYHVKGWMRFVRYGDFPEGTTQEPYSAAFMDCAKRNGGFPTIGYPVSDNSNSIYVHNWEPWGYLCQNVEKKDSYGQPMRSGIMMYVPYIDEALYIGNDHWKLYSQGVNGGFGPDIDMGNGVTLGLPVTEESNGYQRFEGGYIQQEDSDLVLYNFQNQEITRIATGTVGTTLTSTFTVYALSQTQVFVSSNEVPGAYAYEVYRDGVYVGDLDTIFNFVDFGL
ncbi:MAG: CHAP domain-containing protein, partial [Candidatus Colwellbacteria bacterium]|nr:CHAP domain-containing protein [Candidatus Colwellbacteria bacterium]